MKLQRSGWWRKFNRRCWCGEIWDRYFSDFRLSTCSQPDWLPAWKPRTRLAFCLCVSARCPLGRAIDCPRRYLTKWNSPSRFFWYWRIPSARTASNTADRGNFFPETWKLFSRLRTNPADTKVQGFITKFLDVMGNFGFLENLGFSPTENN